MLSMCTLVMDDSCCRDLAAAEICAWLVVLRLKMPAFIRARLMLSR